MNLLKISLLLLALPAAAQRTVPQTTAIAINGQVKHQLKLDAGALAHFKTVEIGDYAIHNHHGEVKTTLHGVKGVLLTDLIDSAGIEFNKPRQLCGTVMMLSASDGFSAAYSWGELYNSPAGRQVYVVTYCDNKVLTEIKESIMVIATGDNNTGSRFIKGVATISVTVPQ